MINVYLCGFFLVFCVIVLGDLVQILFDFGCGWDFIDVLWLVQVIQLWFEFEIVLDDVIGKYGFCIMDFLVDSDVVSFWICVQFSELLCKFGVDYVLFVKCVDQCLVVVVEGNQFCVLGFEYGECYILIFCEGLFVESGEIFVCDIFLNFYV